MFGYDVHLVLSDRNTLTVHSKTLSGLPISIWSPESSAASSIIKLSGSRETVIRVVEMGGPKNNIRTSILRGVAGTLAATKLAT